MKTYQPSLNLAADYERIPTGLHIAMQALLALAAVNREYDGLVARAQELLAKQRLGPIEVGLMELELERINARKGETGAAVLRDLGLDVDTINFTIDEDTGEVFRLVRRVPA